MLPKSSTLRSYLPEVGTTNISSTYNNTNWNIPWVLLTYELSIAHSETGFRTQVCVRLIKLSEWLTDSHTEGKRLICILDSYIFYVCRKSQLNTCQVMCHAVIVLLHFLRCAVLPPFCGFHICPLVSMQMFVPYNLVCTYVRPCACVPYWFRALAGLVVPGADLLWSRPSSFISITVIVAAGLVASGLGRS